MHRSALVEQIRKKNSYLCIGLDTDISLIPKFLLTESDPVFAFNKAIIDATHHLCVAYKINTAFYETRGAEGWTSLQKTANYIPSNIFKIADAKRGDIGNTSAQYAKAFFETMDFDAITVAPYMGEDSVRPFLDYGDKWTIVLALTSNKGASDFELEKLGEVPLFEAVMTRVMRWGNPGNLMFVTGATQALWFKKLRSICPEHFFLVPGVGTQGGDLRSISAVGLNRDIGLLVNSSRGIIYSSAGEDFAIAAAVEAARYQKEMLSFCQDKLA
ncbi:MAG: orotidine-5'-phosphate decarboxylase [Chitinophagaceae bacterium]